MKPVKILIIDDSALIRNILLSNLQRYSDIEIVGTAADPYEARDLIVKLKPDVLTLDIEMPKMNGIEFMQVLMKHYPLPVIIFSSLVSGNCDTSIKCLEAGALDVIAKPSKDLNKKLPLLIDELHKNIIEVSYISPEKILNNIKITKTKKINLSNIKTTNKVIAIGASTGGTKAIEKILMRLPYNIPPIIITQHMPAGFTNSFAKRLNNLCNDIQVQEAESNVILKSGNAYIAPGNYHLLIKNHGAEFKIIIKNGPKVSGHRPSVNVMFSSVSKVAGRNAIGIILTGMGKDGADGLLEMFASGSETIAQDELSSIVFGMPDAAINYGAVKYVVSLNDIPEKIIKLL